jgi:hypothetical protein
MSWHTFGHSSGKSQKPLRSRDNFIEEVIAQSWRLRVVILDRLVKILLSGRDESRFCCFFRASIISSKVTEGISLPS